MSFYFYFMAKRLEKEKAIALRLQGQSYSQIKAELGVSKSTLSLWLREYPLFEYQIKKLFDDKHQWIERIRNTKALKKQKRRSLVLDRVSKDINTLSSREFFLAGLFLYWGEGGKTQETTTCLTNTNPAALIFFIRWLLSMGIEKDKIKIRLQIYKDMNKEKIINFWSNILDIPRNQFNNPQVKKTNQSELTYKSGFGNGTCTVAYYDRDLSEYVLSGLAYIASQFKQVHAPGLGPGT